MGFKEWGSRLLNRLSGREEQMMQPNLPNGGTGGYRPGAIDVMGTRSMQLNQLNDAAQQAAGYQQENWQGGMNPVGAMNAPQNMGQTAWQNGYPQGTDPNIPQAAWPNPAQGYAPTGAQPWQQPAQVAQAPQMPPQPTDQQTAGNISYMNNAFCNENGTASRHVERITSVYSLGICFRVIEFLRNGESVIVNLEAIPGESEVKRVLDLLAGAAFTLDCSMTRINSSGRCYLLAPMAVTVMQDETLQRAADYRRPTTPQPEEQPPQRSRGYGSYAGPRYQAR